MKRIWLPATLLMLVAGTLLAGVFKWFDEEGGVHYGDCPPVDCPAEPVELPPPPSAAEVERAREEHKRLQEQIAPQAEPLADTAPQGEDSGSVVPATAPPWQAACFSTPEGLLGEGVTDPQGEVLARHLTEQEYSALQRLLPTLQGRWRGELQVTRCLGTEQAPRPEELLYAVDADGSWRGNRLLIDAELTTREITREPLFFWWLADTERLRFGTQHTVNPDMPRWDIEPLLINDTVVALLRKYRIRQGRWRLEFIALQRSGETLLLQEFFFTQGVLSDRRVWRLQRR